MSVLAVIPARGGSKGIPRKNLRELHGKPLIRWTIESAQQAASISRLIVSTDDEEIANYARSCGVEVPFLRPREYASDTSPGIDPVLHALREIPGFEHVLLLQPTSPLRVTSDIDGIVEFLRDEKAPAAISVSPAPSHPAQVFRLDSGNHIEPFVDRKGAGSVRRQDLTPGFVVNGALYLAETQWLQETREFIAEETLGYVMPVERSLDIDDELDWFFAESLLEKLNYG